MNSNIKTEANRLYSELCKFHDLLESEKDRLEEEQDENAIEREDDPDVEEIDNENDIDLLREQALNLDSIIAGFEEIKDALA